MSLREAIAAYETGQLYWPVSLLNEIENTGRGRGFDWVVAIASAFLDQSELENQEKLIDWVREAATAKERQDLSGLRDKSLEIWNARRDHFHIAISHLYAALVFFLEGNYKEYRQTIFFAISSLSEDPAFGRIGLPIVTEVFRRMQPDADPAS